MSPEQLLQHWQGVLVRLPTTEGATYGHVLSVKGGTGYMNVQPGSLDAAGVFIPDGEPEEYMSGDMSFAPPAKKDRVKLLAGHSRTGAVGVVVSIDQGEYVVKLDGEQAGLQIVEKAQCARLVQQ
jgi:hypothetical protein